jgi:hypothetical protein
MYALNHHVCVSVCEHTYIHTYIHTKGLWNALHDFNVYKHIHNRTHIHIHNRTHIHIHNRTHIHIHNRTHIHIHNRTHHIWHETQTGIHTLKPDCSDMPSSTLPLKSVTPTWTSWRVSPLTMSSMLLLGKTACMCVCMCVYVCVCEWVCVRMHVCMYVYIYIYIYIYIHTTHA